MTNFKKLFVALMATMTMTMAMAGGDIAPAVDPQVSVEAPVSKDFYVGVNTAVGVAGDRNNIDWFGFSTVGVDAGYTFYRNGGFETSVEGRYATDTSDWFETYNYGVYLKPGYDMGGATAYGLIGYQDGFTHDAFDFDGELGYGGGLSTEVFGYDLFVDYLYGDTTKSEIVTVGLNYNF